MHTASMSFIVSEATRSSNSANKLLKITNFLDGFACWLLLPRLKKVCSLVSYSCTALKIEISEISSRNSGEFIDPDKAMRGGLGKMRLTINENIEALDSIVKRGASEGASLPRVFAEFAKIAGLFSELEEQAIILQQTIAAHDEMLRQDQEIISESSAQSAELLRRVSMRRHSAALAQETILVPSHLSFEEAREYIIAHADHK